MALGSTIKGLIRRDRYEIPVDAIREMIVNAVCHRSYLESSTIQVAIYNDCIEVTSPGALMSNIDLQHALRGSSSIRNINIAKVLYEMDIRENWGSGLKRIRQLAAEYKLKDPEFIEMGCFFRVIFYRTPIKTTTRKAKSKNKKK